MAGWGGFERAEGWPKSAAKTSLVRFAEVRTACAARCEISSEGGGIAGSLVVAATSAMMIAEV